MSRISGVATVSLGGSHSWTVSLAANRQPVQLLSATRSRMPRPGEMQLHLHGAGSILGVLRVAILSTEGLLGKGTKGGARARAWGAVRARRRPGGRGHASWPRV